MNVAMMAGVAGFEPATNRLTVCCATAAPHPSNHLNIEDNL